MGLFRWLFGSEDDDPGRSGDSGISPTGPFGGGGAFLSDEQQNAEFKRAMDRRYWDGGQMVSRDD